MGPVDFTIYAAVRANYETGLTAPTVTEGGGLPSQNYSGIQAEIGAYGGKSWRKFNMGLDYRGDYRRSNQNQNQSYNGTNQALSLDLNFLPTNRTSFFVRETGGTTNRAFGAFSAPAFADQRTLGVPLNEVYDSRVYFSQTSGGMSYRKSARTTYSILGEGFVVKRSSPALIGTQGYRAAADYDYRLTSRDSIGVTYNYIHFEYPRIYGSSDVHGFTGRYMRQGNRNCNFQFVGGYYRVETVGTQEVQLSPEVAIILGRKTGVEAFRRVAYQPQVDVSTNYTGEHSHFTVGYLTGVTPGNGVYITSRQEVVRTGYSYSGLRHLSLGLSAGYTRFNSLGLVLGDFSTLQGGGGMSYKLAQYLDFSLQVDRRKFTSPTVNGRSGTSFVGGLTFSPARFPMSIW